MSFQRLTVFFLSLAFCGQVIAQSVSKATFGENCSGMVRSLFQGAKRSKAIVKVPAKYIGRRFADLKKHLPYFYFVPLPRFIKKLDFDLVDLKKEEYLKELEAFLGVVYDEFEESFKEVETFLSLSDDKVKGYIKELENLLNSVDDKINESFSLSIPKNNEEKLALIEAIIEFVSHNTKRSEDFTSSFRERQRKVAKLLNKWKPSKKLLSPERFKKILDQYYLWVQSSLFQIKHTGRMFRPREPVAKMARLRWEYEVVKQSSLKAMKKFGMVADVEYTRERYKNALGSLFKFFIFYGSNSSFYNSWLVRNKVEAMAAGQMPINSEEAFLEFRKRFKKLEIAEFYKDSITPFISYAFMGVILFHTYEEIREFIEVIKFLRQQQALQPLPGVVEREEIEDWLMLHLHVRVEEVLGEPPSQGVQQEFKDYIASLKIAELDEMRVKVEGGDRRPLFICIVKDSVCHNDP